MTKKPRRNWDRLLQGSISPCFVIDAKRRLVFFNAGCEEIFGWSSEEVFGQVCQYMTEPDSDKVEAVTSTLCPPEEVWGGKQSSVAAYVQHRQGNLASRLIEFLPLMDEEEQVQAVLGILLPLPEPTAPKTSILSQHVHTELAALRIALRQQYGFDQIVAHSPQMQRVLTQARMAVNQSEPVCLIGEPGVGKEFLARTIHHADNPQGRTFVPLDCKKLTARQLKFDLLELFDQEEQSSLPTGLQSGTIYLKQAQLLPRDIQQWILEQAQIGKQSQSHRPRLILGTTESPDKLEEAEIFLSEFYYYITPIQIEIPSLRERIDDLPLLAQYFLEEENRTGKGQLSGFHPDVWKRFNQYQWPGNLTELRGTIQQAVEVADDILVGPEDLPFSFRTGIHLQTLEPSQYQFEPLEQSLKRIERELILEAYQQCGQNKSQTAKVLGLTRPKLYRRLETLGLTLEEEEQQS